MISSLRQGDFVLEVLGFVKFIMILGLDSGVFDLGVGERVRNF